MRKNKWSWCYFTDGHKEKITDYAESTAGSYIFRTTHGGWYRYFVTSRFKSPWVDFRSGESTSFECFSPKDGQYIPCYTIDRIELV